MPLLATPPSRILPARRAELIVRPLGDGGNYVVKDPLSGAYYHLGAEEHFLLMQLDGMHGASAITAAFADRFGQALESQELDEFVALAQTQGFLAGNAASAADARSESEPAARSASQTARPLAPPRPSQSILYWRKKFWDPDRCFTWLEPKLWFFWTRTFLVLSSCGILAAGLTLLTSPEQLASSLAQALRWETALWVALTLFVVTMLHESAHGLTCKHFGGEVHEIGFLLMFFLPCFYCNVSDAWLFREKWKRLLVTLAGGYFELCVWSLAVFVWRVTLPGSLPHHLAFVVLASCGIQSIFHFNPLLKLDGYYLLSDWCETPNLRERAQAYFKGQLRRLLWGGPRPATESRPGLLIGFGLASWLYSLTVLGLVLWGFGQFLWPRWGWLGLSAVSLLGLASTRGLFQGITGGEVRKMLVKRYKRSAVWLLSLSGLAAALGLVQVEDRASGPCRLRAATRAELRAPVAGFLSEVYGEEGGRVSRGAIVARLEIADLDSRRTQKQAEVAEVQARLRLLEIGPRPDEVAEQRHRVERMEGWRDLARKDLGQARQALHEELARLDQLIAQHRAELSAAQESFQRACGLREKKALPEEDHAEAQRKYEVATALLAQAQLQKRHREALGTREAIAGLDAEAELARREKDLADARATLNLLEAGTRPEEIEAERARLARLTEELRYLEGLQGKLAVASPVDGLLITPRLKEKVWQYVREGDVICLVEEPAGLEVEIALPEQQVARVRAGQQIRLKLRALPFETFPAKVERIAPAAGAGQLNSTVSVYCRLDQGPADLRSEMTGYARIYTGRRPIGEILLDRVLRIVRTEFWW